MFIKLTKFVTVAYWLFYTNKLSQIVKECEWKLETNCIRIICIPTLHSVRNPSATLFTFCPMYYSLVSVACAAFKNVFEVFVRLPNLASTIEFDSCFVRIDVWPTLFFLKWKRICYFLRFSFAAILVFFRLCCAFHISAPTIASSSSSTTSSGRWMVSREKWQLKRNILVFWWQKW